MIEVKTKYKIASDSLDHLYPEGVHYDNNVSIPFVENVENHFKRKINFLDLGCAGGALAVSMHQRGHLSVGIDGSDGCYNVRSDVREHFNNELPAGYTNWNNYLNKVLFTADITKPYEILNDGETVKFDLITCWDVMEHFEPDAVDGFLKEVYDKLNDGGIFIASIALYGSGTKIEWPGMDNIEYHKSIFDRSWWQTKIKNYLEEINYPFGVCNREYITLHDSRYLVYSGKKKIK